MPTQKRQHDCDNRLLRGFLEQSLTAEEEADLEAHLDDCAVCRKRIGDSAAGQDWWNNASRFLRHDRWDEELVAIDSRRCAMQSAELAASDEISLRQIKEWFDPADDPRYVGRFGGYEILGVVGRGGMGVVLKGFEPSLNRCVAIKVLSPALAGSGAARKRFAREAQAAAAVLHENVIAIHRVAESHGLPYLVMPYVNGVSLQQRIDEEGPLPLPAVLRIGRQIAAGLAAAHAQGLVHRDIKPANILLERSVERVTITDFGLARAADDASLTHTGVIAGTPQYMSPEQSRGEAIDARSDLFSLGSVLYAMCTGRPPFRADSGYGILRRISDGEPRRLREVNPEIPGWCAALIGRLHAKSPSDRIQRAGDVAELLEQCLAHVQEPAAMPLPECLRESARAATPRRSRWGLVTAAACVVVLAALGGWAARERFSKPGDASPQSNAANEQQRPATAVVERPSAPPSWEGVSDEALRKFDRALSDFQNRSAQDWPSDPRD